MTLYFSICGFAFNHVSPIPYIPISLDPAVAGDIVTQSILRQIHYTLFSVDNKNQVYSDVISKFEISNDQLVYNFKLKKLKFHSGKDLVSKDIKVLLLRIIKAGLSQESFLLNILGVDEFRKNKKNDVSGFQIIDKQNFRISLYRSDSRLIYKLSGFKYSVINPDDVQDGLGHYKYLNKTKTKITLEKMNMQKNGPSTIIYAYLLKEKAIEKFKKKEVHDLIFYSLKEETLKQLDSLSQIIEYSYPRTYALFLNSSQLDTKEREAFRSIINSTSIVNNCGNGKWKTLNSIIPPGFKGYIDHSVSSKRNNCPKVKTKIIIPVGLGNEKCIQKEINNMIKKCSLGTSVKSFSEIITNWGEKNLPAYVGYVEAEQNESFFENFKIASSFYIGDLKDTKIIRMISDFESTTNLLIKTELARKINLRILKSYTVIPLYYKKMNFVISNRYEEVDIGLESASRVSMSKLNLTKKAM